MQSSMLRYFQTHNIQSAATGGHDTWEGVQRVDVKAPGNNESSSIVINDARSPAVDVKAESSRADQAVNQCSPLSEITGVAVNARSPPVPISKNHQSPSCPPSTDASQEAARRTRRGMRPAQDSDFEYAEDVLEALDELPVKVEEVSEYEQLRRERIAANLEKLQALGLQNGLTGMAQVSDVKAPKRKKAVVVPDESQLRRSSRARTCYGSGRHMSGSSAITHAQGVSYQAGSPSEQPVTVVDAPCYALQTAAWAACSPFSPECTDFRSTRRPWQSRLSCDDGLQGFQNLHCSLASPPLKAIYSLDWHGNMVAAAGKEGWCSLFCVPEAAAEAPRQELIASRLHRSWLADVQLLPALATSDANLPWLLSACNDSTLALWDLARVDGCGRFAQLASTADVHTQGIFSMHLRPSMHGAGGRSTIEVLTASKDATVVLTAVQTTGMQVVQRWSSLHSGTVKCVRWRDASVAATAGNDRTCKLVDVRCESEVAKLSGGHASALNSVAWASAAEGGGGGGGGAPCGQSHASEHHLVTASFDAAMYVHDVRQPSTPLLGLAGHTQLRKGKAMQQAAFTWGGRGVVCGGEGGQLLSLYDIRACEPRRDGRIAANVSQQGLLVSQTEVGHRVTTTSVKGHCVAVAGPGSSISVLRGKIEA
eukprot:jgi/Ulvmu1/6260/UM028_0118.1